MEFDMTGTLWVCAVCNLHNHTWLPAMGPRVPYSKSLAAFQIHSDLSSVTLGFGFQGKVIFLLKSSWEANWALDCPAKSEPQRLG